MPCTDNKHTKRMRHALFVRVCMRGLLSVSAASDTGVAGTRTSGTCKTHHTTFIPQTSYILCLRTTKTLNMCSITYHTSDDVVVCKSHCLISMNYCNENASLSSLNCSELARSTAITVPLNAAARSRRRRRQVAVAGAAYQNAMTRTRTTMLIWMKRLLQTKLSPCCVPGVLELDLLTTQAHASSRLSTLLLH